MHQCWLNTGSRGSIAWLVVGQSWRFLSSKCVLMNILQAPRERSIMATRPDFLGLEAWRLPRPAPGSFLAPDWKTVTWAEAERKKGQAWGLKTIERFHTHRTPPIHP
jgi:hypothetical protein